MPMMMILLFCVHNDRFITLYYILNDAGLTQNNINDTRREILIICITQLAVRFIASFAVAAGQVQGKTDKTYMITCRITRNIN